MSIWKSDEKLRSFASLISPSKIILFGKKYQASDAVFVTRWNTSKIVRNTPLRVIFSTLSLVLHLVIKHCVSCLIYYFSLRAHTVSLRAQKWKPSIVIYFFISFLPSFFACFFFSLSPSAFTFKGHNSLMKSISPKRRLKLKTKSSNGIPSTSLNMLIKCTLNEFFVRPSVQCHPSAAAVSHE